MDAEAREYHARVIAKEIGDFSAVLSVPKSREKQIYWSLKELPISVIQNQMKSELDDLSKKFDVLTSEYEDLKSKYDHLLGLVMNLSRASPLEGESSLKCTQ